MKIPKTMWRWNLYGAGFDLLGRAGRPEEVPVPDYGANELLARPDACGLCFSDTKVIALGGNHPRLVGRDMSANPVTLGHEVVVTIVGVGANLEGKYRIGERYVIQPDVFYQGKGITYGYAIAGGLSEYSVIPETILNGDEGCYLLPVRADTGLAEAALTEPWACVTAAYHQAHRDSIRDDGVLLVVLETARDGRVVHDFIHNEAAPAHVVVVCAEPLHGEVWQANITTQASAPADYAALKQRHTDGRGFNDILVVGNTAPETIEQAAAVLADHGILNIVRETPIPRKLALDIGRIHYNWHHYIGADLKRFNGVRIIDQITNPYSEARTAELLPDGICWFVGAGGPMGQMHVQRALQHPAPPKRIVATDVDAVRLQSVVDRFGGLAAERGLELFALNPNTMSAEKFDSELRRMSEMGARQGYDDIVSLVPLAAPTAHAAQFLADGGWLNIFAGVARGTLAEIDVNRIIRNGCRIVGSTGSSLADMRETLNRMEQGELTTRDSLAAIGGMEAAKEGLQAVKEGRFAGKTLIFPQIHNLPLTPLPELKNTLPTVYAKLRDGQFWTNEAEAELLRLHS